MTTTSTPPQVSPVAQIRALHERLIKEEAVVANGKVAPVYGMDNYFVVEGSNNARYLVNGSCCCPDAQQRAELTKGHGKHRLAAILYAEQQAQAETAQTDKPKATRKAKAESPQSEEQKV